MPSLSQSPGTIDPNSGFNSATRTFHSLRPPVPLPPPSQPFSITQYASSLLNSSTSFSPETTSFLIDAASATRVSYSQFLEKSQSLSASLLSKFPELSGQKVALIISPPSLDLPVLYFSLISLNVIVSPANPLSTPSELAHLVELCKPVIAFATSSVAKNLPALPLGTILMDSPEFLSMFNSSKTNDVPKQIYISQSDTAAILYSSGTTGRVKGVELTHRNLITVIADLYYNKRTSSGEEESGVALFTLPLFHVFGFFMLIRGFALGETLVLMERFDFVKMLEAVEKYRVNYMPVSPPIVVALAKSDLVAKYDLSSLKLLGSGGAALGRETSERFTARFPNVEVAQGYGMTETGGGATGMNNQEESTRYGSGGRLSASIEGKIVDPGTGKALGPGQQGELWLRGPNIMKGYVADNAATAETLTSDGWLKTGDLCYFDSDGFLYIVDRLKELIKYKAYQVPPAELEHIIHSIPGVADVAVIPYPDEDAGQIPMAYVVRSPGSNISEREIQDFVAKQVSPYKKVRRVAFINAIPKSPAGKILRRELVNHALSGASARL
ncbi:4-coumarate--CoA ligase-like 9 [Apium graveolens]|uniref:4-coumarate--CoA ligase-like 9 n=1 Tax=Apium graveolens TaxID=4045 RepID=UPI0027A8C478|nr:4CL3 [Apium graveolens]